jgi:hypothetical protein
MAKVVPKVKKTIVNFNKIIVKRTKTNNIFTNKFKKFVG